MGHRNSSGRMTFSVLSSGIFHAAAAVLILTMHLVNEKKTETTEVVIQEPVGLPTEQVEATPSQEPVGLPAAPPAEVKAEAPAAPAPVVAAAKPAAPKQITTLPAKVVTTQTQVAPLQESEVDEVLDSADHDSNVASEKHQLDDVDSELQEADKKAEQLKEQESLQAAEMAQVAAAARAKERAEIEKAQEQKKQAQVQEQAKRKADVDAQAKARAEARAQEVAAAQARYEAAREAAIAANSAAATEANEEAIESATVTGNPNGYGTGQGGQQEVRQLDELKQMPGNQKPMYEQDDRLKNRSGRVIYHAFVSKNGTPSEIKLIQSSGHPSLDEKTLKAIRGWKFFPGQEGWVEIPFHWDLKGEPRIMGGTLRKVSGK